MAIEVISVNFNGQLAGALSYDTNKQVGFFEYDRKFAELGLELSPIHMPLSDRIYSFPALDKAAFKGLPGMLADSLPDDFGNAVLNAWLAMQGDERKSASITPTERLQYTGIRGMGALTYHPATRVKHLGASKQLEVSGLVRIAQDILDSRSQFKVALSPQHGEDKEAMLALLSVGMSAGGARPKAVVAFNDDFTQVRSGQADVPAGFTHYLMKFDGVSERNSSKETFGDPLGFGAMEYTYYQMAQEVGIDMAPCHLLTEGDRRHFITQRFDRVGNQRIHTQTLNAMAHVSYQQPGSYSYAELFQLARQLRLPLIDAQQLFLRMVYNVIARNHDDHSKNFAFQMDEHGTWRLAPAYDVAYSYKPGSEWVNSHWMSLNGKREHFSREDFYAFSAISPRFNRAFVDSTIEQVTTTVATWADKAKNNDVPAVLIDEISSNLRLAL